jgi:hypothetical protein
LSTGQFQPDTGQFAPGREKTGGRQRGTPNKTTLELRRLQEELEDRESDEMPLDYMLRIMRSRSADPPRRDAMARSAAQYCHPQLQAVAHKLVDEKGNPLAPVVNLTVSTPKLEDRTPKLTHDGAKKGESEQ